jgi:UDPglucose 6-dehydrogenase
MNVAVVGTGTVGLVSSTCFAEMGVNVVCVDVDQAKIDSLQKGEIPIYEPDLAEMMQRNQRDGRLHFTADLANILDEVEIVFCAVDASLDEYGSADLQGVLSVARVFGQNINKYTVFVTESTVPVGTTKKIGRVIQKELDRRGVSVSFDVACNPEFLKEGSAIVDFMKPERIVVGVESEQAKELMTRLYRLMMLNNFRVVFTDIPSAEMIKFTVSSMLATRISFMNDIANLCELVGADVNMVCQGVDGGVAAGNKNLYPSCGYGGHGFATDVKALIQQAQNNGCRMRVLEAAEDVNRNQKKVLFKKLFRHYRGYLIGKTVALWGLTANPETTDMSDGTSLVLLDLLVKAGVNVRIYDPVAMDECKRRLSPWGAAVESIVYCGDMYEALLGVDALLLVTGWKPFASPDFELMKKNMKQRFVVDGRNVYDAENMKKNGFVYETVGYREAF